MTIGAYFRKLALAATVAAGVYGSCSLAAAANETTRAAGASGGGKKGKFSLIQAAPELYFTAMRHNNFYGDPNTVHGGISERSYLLGNLGGARDDLIDRSIYFDLGVTQFLQSNLSGGEKTTSSARLNGSGDAWLWLDTGKAGLWDGGAVYMHGELNWDESVNGEVGSLVPANFDAVMPGASPPAQVALSEAYLLQTLPAKLLLAVGKIDMAAWADTHMFANRERSQFLYTGLVSNAIAGVFFPYTTLGGWLTWSPSKAHTVSAVYAQSESSATVSGFDTLFNGNDSFAGQYIFATEIAKKPGRYLLAGAYSTRNVTGFAISPRFGLGDILSISPLEDVIVGVPVLDTKSGNYAVIGNFAQYLWVKDDSAKVFNRRLGANPHAGLTHHSNPPVGIGIFGRAGWAPDDRNAIDRFFSLGIGGYGMLIPGRDDDQWGIGWVGSHISNDLRDLTTRLRRWEHAVEISYNFALTPAAHLSVNTQVIRPAKESLDTAVTLGARLQLDF